MTAKWIVAFACGAALALGACSGSNPAPTTGNGGADNGGGTGNGDGTDPAAPDERSAEQKAFDEARDAAAKALEDARRMLNEAVDQAEAAETDEQRAAAQAALAAARTALTNALSAAEALDPPEGDLTRLGRKSFLVADATEAQTDADMRIPRAEASVAWYGTPLSRGAAGAALATIPEVAAVRTDRAKDGSDSDDLLKASDIPPVMYEDGKILISGTAASSGDMLRLRGYAADIYDNAANNLEVNYQDINVAPTAGVPTVASQLLAAFQITSSGLVARLGGKAADGPDFRKVLIPAGDRINPAEDPDGKGWDLRLTFGPPQLAADDNGDFLWTARLMPDASQIAVDADAATKAAFKVGSRIFPVTIYNIWLSNHVGVDTNLEDPDDPVASARDDEQTYLSYAAYGIMTGRYPSTVDLSSGNSDAWKLRQRVHGFHLGYDSFADEDDMRTTDIGKDDAVIRGKFVGQTMALAVGTTESAASRPIDVANADRLRGDVTLTATISGTSGNNKIEGTMSNFEVFDPSGTFWKAYTRISGDVELEEGNIDPDGSFDGVVDAPSNAFENGRYMGRFYGPVSGLEAAGAWFLNADSTDSTDPEDIVANKGIMGSFGAKMQ